ncbi:MAG: tetratricopeptide repeat protein [Elainella sp. Prado103]|nr:tetratricopeptide repeat protein [Elainella sp. Prado103]
METIETYLKQAEHHREQQQWEDMLSCCQRASELQPTTWEPHTYAGDALLGLQRWEEAITAYERSLQLNPHYDWTYHNLSVALCQVNRLEEAIHFYAKLSEVNPEFWQTTRHDFQVQVHRADILFRQERWQEASEAYQRAIAIHPNFIWHWLNLARCYVNLEQPLAAGAALKQAIQLQSEDAFAYYLLGEVAVELGEWEVAVSAYQAVSQLPANSAEIVDVAAKLNRSLQNQAKGFVDRDQANSPSSPTESLQPQLTSDLQTPISPQSGAPRRQASQQPSASPGLKLWGSQAHLQSLYSADLKLLIPTPEVPALRSLLPAGEFSLLHFKWDMASQTGVLLPWGQTDAADWVEIQFAPQFVLGCCVASPAGQQQLEALFQWWQTRSGSPMLPTPIQLNVTDHPIALKANFWQQIANQLNGETRQMAQRLSTLQQQYLELRTLHENLHNTFVSVEAFLSQAKLPPLQLAFEYQASKKQIFPETKQGVYWLRQLLPIPSRGLAQVEIHIAQTYLHARGHLTIALWVPEANSDLARWEIPYEHLQTGWLALDLPQIDAGYRRDVELVIEWHTQLGPAPRLSLGDLQPIPEAQLLTGDRHFDRSLAFRLWTGLPGSRLSLSPYAVASNPSEPLPTPSASGYLGQATLARVTEVTPNLPTDEVPYLLVIGEGEKIQTQPRSDSPTIALLPYGCPPQTTAVTATVATEHAEAGVVEYAMAILPTDAKPEHCFTATAATLAQSDWIAVQPGTPRQIQVTIAQPPSQHCHLVIATRLPADSPERFAWARWRSFQITLDPPIAAMPSADQTVAAV